MSTQLNEMGAWFFLRMREWGIGRVGKFKLGRAPLWEKRFWISWARKIQKRPPFPHAVAFHLPSWFWNGNFYIHVAAGKKRWFWVWTFHGFLLSDDLNLSRFWFSCVDCFYSCFLLFANCFPEYDFPVSDFVSLIWNTSNIFVLAFFAAIGLAPAMFINL